MTKEVYTLKHSPLWKTIVLFGIPSKKIIGERRNPKKTIKNQRRLRSIPSRVRTRGPAGRNIMETDFETIRQQWEQRLRDFRPWAERRRAELTRRGPSQPARIQAGPAATKPSTGLLWKDGER
jgi:hypothetical protein